MVLIKASSIPKTSSGKIQRHACRDGYLAGTLAAVATWSHEAGDEVVAPSLRRRERLDEATWVEEGDTSDTISESPSIAEGTVDANGVVVRPSPLTPGKLPTKVPVGQTAEIADVVYAKVREIGRERVGELDWDTNIFELGLDSLERMEIVASLEEAFGGRFPEQVLPSMETCGEVVEAIQRYMGGAAKRRSARPTTTKFSQKISILPKVPITSACDRT